MISQPQAPATSSAADRDAADWDALLEGFPTVAQRPDGCWGYWEVADDLGCPTSDLQRGEALGRRTLVEIRVHPEAAHVLRRILRDIDHESLTGQGFLNVVEAALADPETALAETAR